MGLAIVVHVWVVPELVARYLRHELAARGFPAATLRVTSVGIDHVRLTDVDLGDGTRLAGVELDAGWSLLWRRPHVLTIRGADISSHAVQGWASRHHLASRRPPIDELRLDACTLHVAGTRLEVAGTIALATRAIDLRAHTPTMMLGGFTLRDVEVTARSSGEAVRTCARARVAERSEEAGGNAPRGIAERATFEACASLPPTMRVATLLDRALEVTWTAESSGMGPRWRGRGKARLARDGEALRIEDSDFDVRAPTLSIDKLRAHGVHVVGSARGTLTSTSAARRWGVGALPAAPVGRGATPPVEWTNLMLTGTARAARVAIRGPHTTRLTDLVVPFDLRITAAKRGYEVRARHALVARAARASLAVAGAPVQATEATLVLAAPGVIRRTPPRSFAWRADTLSWRGISLASPRGTLVRTPGASQRVRWASVKGPVGFSGGAGAIALRERAGRPQIVEGELAVLGGRVFVSSPQTADALVLRAQALQLPRVLAAFGERVESTGLLDGQIVLGADGAPRSISVHARAPGLLRVRDARWRARWAAEAPHAVHARVAGALADFTYQQLTAVLAPPGTSPELQISVRGRGTSIPQAIDLVVHLRGVRDAVRDLAHRVAW